VAEYEYKNIFTLPPSYMEKTVVITAEATDLFGNVTTMEPTTFKVNVLPEELYLVGGATDAGWDETNPIAFKNTGEGTFEVIANLYDTGYGFKFIGGKDWDHGVWGFETEVAELLVDGYTGTLYQDGGSANIPPVADPGLYKITVDIENLAFTINKVTFPDNLFLVGGSCAAGWSENAALPFKKLDIGKFRIFTYLVADDGGVKFLPQLGSWDNDWGMNPDTPGALMVDGEDNVAIDEDGFYAIEVDFNAMTYELVKMQFGIIGDFNSWGTADLMTYVPAKDNYEFTIAQEFTATGTFKFKWDDPSDWKYNFGAPTEAGELSGEAVLDGKNIKITEIGTYDIVLNLDPAGYTYSVTKR